MIKITTNMYENPLLPKIHQLYFLSKNFLEKCGLILFSSPSFILSENAAFHKFFCDYLQRFHSLFFLCGKKGRFDAIFLTIIITG